MSNKLSCLVSLVLVLFLAGFVQAELLLNPGFEAGLESWNAWGSGSGSGFWSDDYNATALADGTAHGGDGYIQVGFNPPSVPWWGYAFAFQEHVVTEGEAYMMSVWYRDGDANGVPSLIEGGGTLTFEWRDAAPTEGTTGSRGGKLPDGVIHYSVDITDEWTYFSAIEVAPPGAKGLTVVFGTEKPFVNIDIDDASFTVVPPQARELTDVGSLLNGDFEYWSDHPDDPTWAYLTTIQDDPAVGWYAHEEVDGSADPWIDNNYDSYYTSIDGTNGDQIMVISWADSKAMVSQNLGTTFVADETYTFAIDIFGDGPDYENWCIGIGTTDMSNVNAAERQKTALAMAASNAKVGTYYLTHPQAYTVLDPPDVFSGWQTRSVSYTATAAEAGKEIVVFFCGGFQEVGSDQYTVFDNAVFSHEIYVSTAEELEAAAAAAMPDDVINLAEGTYAITSQIEIKDGVTFRGAGPGLTIIDGNDLTRAFVAWGDRGATNGQVDLLGNGMTNFTGPIEWAIEGMTIQNCVSDVNNREDILSAARELLNDGGAPYTAETAAENAGAIANNPVWFVVLNSDVHDVNDVNDVDEGLTTDELEAYLANNLPGSDGHLVANDGEKDDGGAICILNGAQGAIRNCEFIGNSAVDDGGAIMVDDWYLDVTIENCIFIQNTCGDQAGAVKLSGAESIFSLVGCSFTENTAPGDDAGAIQMDGAGSLGSVYVLTNCTFTTNSAFDDGGAILATADNSTYVWTGCTFTGNYVTDSGADGGAVRYAPDRAEMTVTNCSFIGNGMEPNGTPVGDDGGVWKTDDDDCGPVTFMNCLFADNVSKDDRILEVKAVSAILNCTFIGNVAGDEALIAVRGNNWNSTGAMDEDGADIDDVTTDDSIIDNCLFINNTLLSNKEIIGDTNNDVFAPTVTNCLFFGNLDQNGDPAKNADGNSSEAGTIDVSAVTDASELVVDPAGDYHLAAGSAAIDASDSATATKADIEGTPAVGVRDVGAYEFVE